MKEPYMHITKWKKPIWKGYILYYSKYMTFYKWQNYEDSKKDQWVDGREEWKDGAQITFWAVELFCMTL